ncbi:MAG TPA: transketolase [Clostridiaceae bacterium]|nr:transketolase [Clostridiaceae bacterium]
MSDRISYLKIKANEIRRKVVTMIYNSQSGHPGGSLSLADIIAVLYFDELRIDPQNPKWHARDRVILSKGHACPVLYAALAMRGYFDVEILDTLRKFESILQGHPDMNKVPGLDITTGSLGQGLSVGVGMALGAKADELDSRIFVLLGDGENNEGQVWEAAMSAAKYKLDNLTAIVDNNGLQNDGFCSEIMPMEPLDKKWEAFGWEVIKIDGHSIPEILDAFALMKTIKGKPVCILAKTVKGKGVSFMENVCSWHGTAPDTEQYRAAIEELERECCV